MGEGRNRDKMKSSSEFDPWQIPVRLLLVIGYGGLSFFIGIFLAGGPDGGGVYQPLAFMTSWAVIIWIIIGLAVPRLGEAFLALLFALFLYLVFVLILNMLLANRGRFWSRMFPFAFHAVGGIVCIIIMDGSPFREPLLSVAGLAAFWAYLALDRRLARSKKDKHDEESEPWVV